jgi:hypothetical protein
MLPDQGLPVPVPRQWRELLEELAPAFARRSTFRLFTMLACGLILADRGTVTGMAAAAGIGREWARWAYDGAAQGGKKIAFGNTWAVAAIGVKLPCCPSPVALPALFRLWRGKGAASQAGPGADREARPAAGERRPDRHLPGCRGDRGLAGHRHPRLRQGGERAGHRA